MIDLFFVLFFIPRRVKALAILRGENWVKWTLWTIGVWLGTELVTGFLILIILMTYSQMTNTELNKDHALVIASFTGMAAAVMAGARVMAELAKKPVLPIPTEDI